MLSLLGSVMYLGGSLIICIFLLLPVLFLLLFSVVYFVFDAIQNFRARHGLF